MTAMTMNQRVHFITVATGDLDAIRGFYLDGLGWSAVLDVPDEIIFFQVAPGVLLGFFHADKFRADAGAGAATGTPVATAPGGFNLSHNVESPAAVDGVMSAAADAGARIVKPAQRGAFGGIYHGMFADPNGMVWEVAHNPNWRIDDDGTVHLGA
jgi:catechol 2,3-dioxygenase-like lactoylglutathione lyase family enzyme